MQQLRSQPIQDITVLVWCYEYKAIPESCFSVHHQVMMPVDGCGALWKCRAVVDTAGAHLAS